MSTWGEQHFNCLLKKTQTSPNQTDMSRGRGNVPVSPGSWKLFQCDGSIWQRWEVGYSSVASLFFSLRMEGFCLGVKVGLHQLLSLVIPGLCLHHREQSWASAVFQLLCQMFFVQMRNFIPLWDLSSSFWYRVQYFLVSGWPRGDENKWRSNCSF